MLKRILRAIISGCTSVEGISKKTGMQESAVADALRLLASKGHLRAECSGRPSCVPSCRGCPGSGARASGSIFTVTEKGRRYAERG